MTEVRKDFERWFLSLSRDFGSEELTRISSTGKYFYITTEQLFKQFCLIREASHYLDTNNMTSIGHNSVLHRKFKDATDT